MAYFPNGSSGTVLDNQCAECPIGRHQDAPCPVLLVQLSYNYDQCRDGNEKLREAMNMLINERGICQMKPVVEKYATDTPQKPMRSEDVMPAMREWAKQHGIP